MSAAISPPSLADVVRRLMEQGIGGGDHALIDQLVAPDCIEHQSGHAQGVTGTHATASAIHAGFSDVRITVEDSGVTGDTVWLRARMRGVNSGPFLGYPPTGRSISIDVFDVVRVLDGRIVEHWGLADRLGALVQLGHLAAPEPPASVG
jgi:predicted ester cyclase